MNAIFPNIIFIYIFIFIIRLYLYNSSNFIILNFKGNNFFMINGGRELFAVDN